MQHSYATPRPIPPPAVAPTAPPPPPNGNTPAPSVPVPEARPHAPPPGDRPRAGRDADTVIRACQRFSYREIGEITSNFQSEIGRGAYGTVYRARWHDRDLAVKRLDVALSPEAARAVTEAEIRVLSALHHPNLLELVGYCFAEGPPEARTPPCLVYVLAPNGNLRDALGRTGYAERMRVAIGVARGLAFMHCAKPSAVVHRDVKPENILLDAHLNPLIGDAGLSRLMPARELSTRVSSVVEGCFPYLCPDYFRTGQLTLRADVYSFGVVLLELVTGLRAVDRTRKPVYVVDFAKAYLRERGGLNRAFVETPRLEGLVDPRVHDFPVLWIQGCLKLALECVRSSPERRPEMAAVLRTLVVLRRLNTVALSRSLAALRGNHPLPLETRPPGSPQAAGPEERRPGSAGSGKYAPGSLAASLAGEGDAAGSVRDSALALETRGAISACVPELPGSVAASVEGHLRTTDPVQRLLGTIPDVAQQLAQLSGAILVALAQHLPAPQDVGPALYAACVREALGARPGPQLAVWCRLGDAALQFLPYTGLVARLRATGLSDFARHVLALRNRSALFPFSVGADAGAVRELDASLRAALEALCDLLREYVLFAAGPPGAPFRPVCGLPSLDAAAADGEAAGRVAGLEARWRAEGRPALAAHHVYLARADGGEVMPSSLIAAVDLFPFLFAEPLLEPAPGGEEPASGPARVVAFHHMDEAADDGRLAPVFCCFSGAPPQFKAFRMLDPEATASPVLASPLFAGLARPPPAHSPHSPGPSPPAHRTPPGPRRPF